MSELEDHQNEEERLPFEVEQEHSEGDEPWLISYADLMTLLFGFFAMLFTFAKFEEDKASVKIDMSIAKVFQVSAKSMEALAEKLRKELKKLDAGKDIELTLVEDGKGLEIAFDSAILFTPGSAHLLPESRKPLTELITVLKSTGKMFKIRVEGHTDDNPIRSNIQFPSNWELSAARASIIVRLFEANSFPGESLTAVGYGSARPFLPNRDIKGIPIPENQTKNRRVLVKVNLDLERMLAEQNKKDNNRYVIGTDKKAESKEDKKD